jgi:hypothetical protein
MREMLPRLRLRLRQRKNSCSAPCAMIFRKAMCTRCAARGCCETHCFAETESLA